MRPSVSILVPAYNEVGNLERAIEAVSVAAQRADVECEIVLVNDGSTDGTGERAALLRWLYPSVQTVHHAENRGLRAAYETGLKFATKAYVTWVPGDGEMAAESIANILRAIGSADLVIPYHGTPWNRPWFRRLLTWGSTTQLNVLLGHRLNYYQGTVVYPTEMARRLPRTERGFFFAAEMLAWALEEGCTYTEVPLIHEERQYGVSKAVSWRAIWRAQLLILRLAWRINRQRAGLVLQGARIG